MKNLIFITGNYPWGIGEAFIESEFPFLEKSFDNIWIISNEKPQSINRVIDKRHQVLFFSYELRFIEKLLSLRYLINKTIRQEINLIVKYKGIKSLYHCISTLLASYSKGIKLSRFISLKIISPENLKTHESWVYSYWLNDMATGIGILKKKYPDIKVFSRAHRWDLYPEQSPINYLPLRQFLGKKLDLIITISKHGCNTLRHMINKEDCSKVQCIPLGTSGGKHPRISEGGQVLNIVSCSGLIRRKRVDKIIEALSNINDILINWTHLGGGSEEENILQLADESLSSKENISFSFTGSLTNHDIMEFYMSSPVDLFINSSEDEGIPVSVMEAFSFGIPAIAPNVGGIIEIIDSGINGYLLSKEANSNEITDTIKTYFNLPVEKKHEMQKNAYLKWENNFNAKENYKKFLDKILSL